MACLQYKPTPIQFKDKVYGRGEILDLKMEMISMLDQVEQQYLTLDMASVIINVDGNKFNSIGNEGGSIYPSLTKTLRASANNKANSLGRGSNLNQQPQTNSYLLDLEMSQHSPDLMLTSTYNHATAYQPSSVAHYMK